jgi:hypothetical protein
LDNADVVAILDKNVVNTFPARTIGPSTVNDNNISNEKPFTCGALSAHVNSDSNKTQQKAETFLLLLAWTSLNHSFCRSFLRIDLTDGRQENTQSVR